MSVLQAPAELLSKARERFGRPPEGQRFLDRPYASMQLLLLASAGLLGFGILMAISTTISASHTDGGSIWSQGINEAEFVLLGLFVFWFSARLSPRAFRLLAYPILGLALIALLAVLVPGVGV